MIVSLVIRSLILVIFTHLKCKCFNQVVVNLWSCILGFYFYIIRVIFFLTFLKIKDSFFLSSTLVLQLHFKLIIGIHSYVNIDHINVSNDAVKK